MSNATLIRTHPQAERRMPLYVGHLLLPLSMWAAIVLPTVGILALR